MPQPYNQSADIHAGLAPFRSGAWMQSWRNHFNDRIPLIHYGAPAEVDPHEYRFCDQLQRWCRKDEPYGESGCRIGMARKESFAAAKYFKRGGPGRVGGDGVA